MALRWNMIKGQLEDDGIAAGAPTSVDFDTGMQVTPQGTPVVPTTPIDPTKTLYGPAINALFNQPPPAEQPPPITSPPPVEAPTAAAPVPGVPKTPHAAGGGVGAPSTGAELQDAAGIATDKQSANAALTSALVTTAGNKATAADDQLKLIAQQQKDTAAREAAKKSEFDRLNAIATQEDAKAKAQTFRGYWANKDTGTKLLSDIGVALGSLAQAFGAAGGINIPNTALQNLNRDMEQDWLIQKANLEKQEHVAEAAKRDAHDASIAMEAAHNQYLAGAKEQTAAMIDKAAVANGSQEARAKGAVMSAQLRDEAQADRQKVKMGAAQLAEIRSATAKNYAEAAHLRGGAAEKAPTESQGKANAMLTVMTAEAKRIESLPALSEQARNLLFTELALKNAAEKNPTVDYAARLTGIRKTVEARLKGTDKQSYAAYTAFLDPLVRQRTGANAPASEVAALASPIIPAPGDKAVDLAAKRQRRRESVESFAEQSNQRDVWRQKIGDIYGGVGSAPAPATGGGEVRQFRNKTTGAIVTAKMGPDGQWHPIDQMASR